MTEALLDPGSCLLTLGEPGASAALPVGPERFFGPRGLALLGPDGPLVVADTGHHRLLLWRQLPVAGQPADVCLGQPDFFGEARNAGGAVTAASMNAPVGVCAFAAGLAVADSWNHRVLIWPEGVPLAGEPPALVLGQADFESGQANGGAAQPDAGSLFWPSGLYCDGQRFCVADAGNRRVLIWSTLPSDHRQPADRILGQHRADCRDQNAGTALSATGMTWPHAVLGWAGHLVVADAGTNRLMLWEDWPETDGQPCTQVLGQADAGSGQHNQARPRPTASTLAMPYGLAAIGPWLIVADTANSRLLAWHQQQRQTGAPAQRLHGQARDTEAGDNRWQAVSEDSLCWPYALASCDDRLLIADTGNNRVQLWAADAL